MGVSEEQAINLIDLYFKNFPLIKVYIDRSHREALENHMVISPFGQRKMEYGTIEVFRGTPVYNGALRNSQNVL